MTDQTIVFENDTWLVVGRGITNDAGETFCHLASKTRFRQQRNGRIPVQINVFVSNDLLKAGQ